MRLFRHIITISIYMIICYVCHGADYYFKHIGIGEGLSQSGVTCICTDKQGTIWIGTRFGLNRFRSNTIRNYIDKGTENTPISGNYIMSLLSDYDGHLWVTTEKGISFYNQDEDRFEKLSDALAFSSYEKDRTIWFGGNSHLYAFRENGILENIEVSGFTNILKILPDGETSIMLIDKSHGIARYSMADGTIHKFSIPGLKGEVVLDACIQNKLLWLSVYRKGLYSIDIDSGRITGIFNSMNSELTFDVILTMLPYGNNIWLGTDGGGICILDTDSGNIRTFTDDRDNALPSNSITYLHRDKMENIWAGSVRDGAFGMKRTSVRTFSTDSPYESMRLSNNVVLGFWKTGGQIWTGTDGGGVDKIDLEKGKVRFFDTTERMKISSITEFDENNMILSIYTEGLFLMDKNSGLTSKFTIIDEATNQTECFSGCSPMVYKPNRDELLILAENVYKYSLTTRKFYRFSSDNPNTSGLQLFDASKGLFAFSENGIFRINDTDLTLKCIYKANKSTRIKAAAYAGEKIWIGTDYGLFYLSGGKLMPVLTGIFSRVTRLKAGEGNILWIAADNLLFRYDDAEKTLKVLDESEGFSPNEILCGSISDRDADSSIYLGGTQGLVEIRKDYDFRHKEKANTELKLSGVYVDGNKCKSTRGKVKVPWKFSNIEVEAISEGADPFRKEMFRYTLDGPATINYETYDDRLILPAIQNGKYTVSVSNLMNNGEWSSPVKIAEIIVPAPWYRQWWFIGGMFFLLMVMIAILILWIYTSSRARIREARMYRKEEESRQHIRFLVNISHELRTPLTMIYSPLRRLIHTINDKETKDSLARILFQAGIMRDIINMVLDKERITSSQEALKKSVCDFGSWVKSICSEFSDEAEAKKQKIVYDIDYSCGNVLMDKWKCRTVFSNMMMNAMKFSPDNSVITVKAFRNGTMARVEITDNGPGLGKIAPEKLFTRFGQGNDGFSGTGIGLEYSSSLIHLLGGNIGARDNGNGSTFWFEIPTTEGATGAHTDIEDNQNDISVPENMYPGEEHEAESEKEISQPAITFDLSGKTVLFAEDNPDLRRMLMEEFSGVFKTVITTSNGKEALEMTRKEAPDIVISDIMMPEMDGYSLCEAIKSDLSISHVPVILLTAKSDAESVLTGYKSGADSYIMKPFDIETLINAARNILNGRELARKRISAVSEQNASNAENTFTEADEQLMTKLDKYILDNLSDEDINVSRICTEMGVSRALLYVKIKALTGMGIAQYVEKIKIQEACRLLREGNKAVSEIADAVGFSSARYFSARFRQITGKTPSEWKKCKID